MVGLEIINGLGNWRCERKGKQKDWEQGKKLFGLKIINGMVNWRWRGRPEQRAPSARKGARHASWKMWPEAAGRGAGEGGTIPDTYCGFYTQASFYVSEGWSGRFSPTRALEYPPIPGGGSLGTRPEV